MIRDAFRSNCTLAAFLISLAATRTEAQLSPTTPALPFEFTMSASLGQGATLSPAAFVFPLPDEHTALTASLTLGGPMRRRDLSTELATRTLTKLRYQTYGSLAVGLRRYGKPGHTGFYFGGGASARSYIVRATTTRSTLAGSLVDLIFFPLSILGDGLDDETVSSNGVQAGGYLNAGYAFRTRRGKRQEFGLRFDFAPASQIDYDLVDDGERVTRALSRDFGGAGNSVQVSYRFGL